MTRPCTTSTTTKAQQWYPRQCCNNTTRCHNKHRQLRKWRELQQRAFNNKTYKQEQLNETKIVRTNCNADLHSQFKHIHGMRLSKEQVGSSLRFHVPHPDSGYMACQTQLWSNWRFTRLNILLITLLKTTRVLLPLSVVAVYPAWGSVWS